MSIIKVTNLEGQQRSVEYQAGDTLMEVLREAGYEEVAALCGGSCSCATCHVHILKSPGPLPAMDEVELELLELTDSYDETRSRLSCQIDLSASDDGLVVALLPAE